jgi:hypothetical protein
MHAGHRLVEQQQSWDLDQGTRELHTLLESIRERTHWSLRNLLELEHVHHPGNVLAMTSFFTLGEPPVHGA